MMTDFITNLTPAVGLVVDTVGTALNLFMQPPLVLFVGLGLVGAALAYGSKLLKFGKR
jgi:Na+-driven multidrug efflux pump